MPRTRLDRLVSSGDRWVEVGYGSIKGQAIADRDTLFELYVVPPFRHLANRLCRTLIAASGATLMNAASQATLLKAGLRVSGHMLKGEIRPAD